MSFNDMSKIKCYYEVFAMSKFFIFWYEYPCPLWSTPTVYPNLISFGPANVDAAPKIEEIGNVKHENICFWYERTKKLKHFLTCQHHLSYFV